MIPAPLIGKEIFLTKGVGHHKEKLRSFEMALRNAGIEKCNLVRVSSIFPPGCKIISKNQGIKKISPGTITFCVMSECSSNEPRRLLAASIGLAIPTDRNLYGYLSEHHAYGQKEKIAGDYAEDLAAAMLATTLGLEFDEEKSWDEKKEVYRVSNKVIKTTSITQSALVKENQHTTVITAAVFIL